MVSSAMMNGDARIIETMKNGTGRRVKEMRVVRGIVSVLANTA